MKNLKIVIVIGAVLALTLSIAAPVAAGSLLGPLGGLAAIAIAAVIYIMQRAVGRQPIVQDRLVPKFSPSGAGTTSASHSILAIIENRRLRKTAPAIEDKDRVAVTIDMLPWRTSLAVATLAVLMTDMFI